ncbi:GNAT family N-acetyltransferase [Sporosalibacterium faouarense]|uniref:GNAT family N-acetyltransferase n=1 Tax=Sporosalibacterium faouarense TaxID=516123 RepID=UPI00192BE08D
MNDQEVIKINNMELFFRRITIEDKDKVMNLFRECKDFFVLTEGVIPYDSDSFFYDLPPGKNLEEKYLYGVFDKNSLVAVIDMVSNYPEKGEWIIGLFLIHTKIRGIGLGREIHNLIKNFIISKGAEKLRIGVLEQNTNALKFWNKIGYKQTKITEPRKFGTKESKAVIMNYYLL